MYTNFNVHVFACFALFGLNCKTLTEVSCSLIRRSLANSDCEIHIFVRRIPPGAVRGVGCNHGEDLWFVSLGRIGGIMVCCNVWVCGCNGRLVGVCIIGK